MSTSVGQALGRLWGEVRPQTTRTPRVGAEARTRDRWRTATVTLLALASAVMLATARQYGITFDEFRHADYGYSIVQWYKSGFRDRGALDYGVFVYLGGTFDATAHVLAKVLHVDVYQFRHLLGVAFALLGVLYTARLAVLLAGPRAGFLAAAALLLTPAYYGHAFNNPKDIPIAALFITAIYYTVDSIRMMPRLSWRRVAQLAVVIGLALGIRIISLILLAYLALAFALWLAGGWIRRVWSAPSAEPAERAPASVRSTLRASASFIVQFAVIALGACVLMLVWWPAAQVHPIGHLRETLAATTRYPYLNPILYDGAWVEPAQLPRTYITHWLFLTLPEFYFVALPGGAIALGVLRPWRGWRAEQWIGGALLVTAVVFPIAFQAYQRSVVYDAWRQFLFVAPLLAVLAGCALSWLFTLAQARGARWSRVAVAAAAVSGALTVVDMVRLHPYQTVYFNRAVAGGLAAAAPRYDTEYWGSSMKEGVEWLEANYRPDAALRQIGVTSCLDKFSTTYYLRAPRFEYVGPVSGQRTRPANVFLASPRWRCDTLLTGRVLHVVEREGVPLVLIKEVAPLDSAHVGAR